MSKYMKYKHHDVLVSVRRDLKGKHSSHCLCWSCEWFIPHDVQRNCPIASELFEFCKEHNVTTPVWECMNFIERGKYNDK